MATAPFIVDTTHPGDTDIVSQFPANERTNNRDVLNSWLLVDHNNNPGGHNKLTMPTLADPGAPSAGTILYWSDSTWGYLKTRVANNIAGSVPEILVPTAVMVPYAASFAPSGWLLCNGQAVSRTTFSRLFAFISTTYGVGDGSTTFNVPDMRGRTAAGDDTMANAAAGRLTNAITGFSASATIGQSGGHQLPQLHAHTITDPQHQHGYSDPTHSHGITDPGHLHTSPNNNVVNNSAGGLTIAGGSPYGVVAISTNTATTGITVNGAVTNITISNASTGITINNQFAGNGQNLQPTLITYWIIKT